MNSLISTYSSPFTWIWPRTGCTSALTASPTPKHSDFRKFHDPVVHPPNASSSQVLVPGAFHFHP